MALVGHASEQTQHILLIHKVQKAVAALAPGGHIPGCRQHQGQHAHQGHAPRYTPKAVPLEPRKHGHYHTGQPHAHGAIAQKGRTQTQHAPQRNALHAALHPYIQGVERQHHHAGEHHVYTAGHCRTVHLKAAQRHNGHQHGHCRALALLKEPEAGQHHHRGGYGRRHACRVLGHMAYGQRAECDKPVKEGGLVGHVNTIVDG